jgi:hypothetical protein
MHQDLGTSLRKKVLTLGKTDADDESLEMVNTPDMQLVLVLIGEVLRLK